MSHPLFRRSLFPVRSALRRVSSALQETARARAVQGQNIPQVAPAYVVTDMHINGRRYTSRRSH